MLVLITMGLACSGKPSTSKETTDKAPGKVPQTTRVPQSTVEKPSPAAGKGRYALWFDGRDDLLRTGRWFPGQWGGFCIEAWVKPASVNPFSGTTSRFLAHSAFGDERYLQFRSDKYAFAFAGKGPQRKLLWVNSERKVNREGWHHVAAVHDGKSAILYVDGTAVAQVAATGPFDWDTAYRGSFIGGDPLSAIQRHNYFRGQIDEIRIWNKPRSAGQIREAMHRSIPPDTPDLVAYWNFDEGQGQIARDVSNHKCDAHFGSTPGPDPNDPVYVRSDCPVDGLADVGPAGHLAWFDGQDDQVLCEPLPALRAAGACTVEVWIRPSPPLARACLVTAEQSPDQRDLRLGLHADGSLELTVRTAGGMRVSRSRPAVQPGAWQHIAAVYDGRTVSLRVNGQAVHTETWNQPLALVGEPIRLGIGADGQDPYAGEMDELRIWNVARSEGEIRTAMNRTVAPAQPGLAGYWRFDEGDGQVVRDWSPSVVHAQWGIAAVYDANDPLWIVSDAPLTVSEPANPNASLQQGGALEFDGQDDFVDIGNAPELRFTRAVTVEAWICPTSVDRARPIVAKANSRGKQNAMELQIKDGIVRFRISDGKAECCGDQGWWPVAGKAKIEPGLWHHVAGVYDGKQVSVYTDGVLQGSSAFSGTLADIPFSAKIGMDSDAEPKYFHGQIDEVRIWERGRSQSEILATMNTKLRGDEPGLIGYYPFDLPSEAGLTTPTCQAAIDFSGLNNHGILGRWMMKPETRDPRWVISGAPILPPLPDEGGK